jgi:thioredoxin 1
MENVTSEKVKQLQSEGKKILVDYWAEWCGPCKALIPRLELIEPQYPNVEFVKVNVDENMDSALDLGIRSVPTVIIYDGEKLISRTQGASADTFYKEILNKL